MKEYTIGQLFNLARTFLNDEGVARRKSLKTTVAIRHMLKVNSAELDRVKEIINGEINEMVDETLEDFCSNDKALDGRRIKEAYQEEFDTAIQNGLDELSLQKMPVNFVYVSAGDVERYFTINDGELTESEMDAIEMFVDDEEVE